MNFLSRYYLINDYVTLALCLIPVGCILQASFITVEHKGKMVLADVLKGLASVVFCIIGFVAYSTLVYRKSVRVDASEFKAAKLIIAGLMAGALGDILLNLRFVLKNAGKKIFLAGIAVFLAGHILYLIAIIPESKSLLLCTIIGIVVAAVILVIVLNKFTVSLAFKIFGIIYVGSVVIMTSIAIGNAVTSILTYKVFFTNPYVIFALGAFLFMVSDVILIFNTFGSKTIFPLRVLNLSLYYIGQVLIAMSIFFFW